MAAVIWAPSTGGIMSGLGGVGGSSLPEAFLGRLELFLAQPVEFPDRLLAVSDLPVRIVDNPSWQLGQGTSVGTGVKALPTSTGAAIFLLGDQPHIPQALLRILIDTHGKTLARIIAPFVGSRQANPVMFDRDLFLGLSELGGDAGGRELFSKEDVYKIQWDSAEILWDVDTPGDYERLLNREG